ncbi:MAG: hypothetical protein ACI9KE_006367 [Polyangiales bacterium]|jgi:hypothetical protein
MAQPAAMRPRFELRFAGSVDALREALRRDLCDTTLCEGEVYRANASLWLPADTRSFWSPYLNLAFEADEDEPSVTHVRARFSPHPNVWTFFIALYFAIGVIGVGFGVYGMVAWSLEGNPWWLLGAPASALTIAFVFGASLIGQGLSAGEMHNLRHVVEHACGLSQEVDAAGSAKPASETD